MTDYGQHDSMKGDFFLPASDPEMLKNWNQKTGNGKGGKHGEKTLLNDQFAVKKWCRGGDSNPHVVTHGGF